MTFLTGSRLYGILLIAASLPIDPGAALAATQATALLQEPAPSGPVEARMRRIALALQEVLPQADRLGDDAISWWRDGFRNGVLQRRLPQWWFLEWWLPQRRFP